MDVLDLAAHGRLSTFGDGFVTAALGSDITALPLDPVLPGALRVVGLDVTVRHE